MNITCEKHLGGHSLNDVDDDIFDENVVPSESEVSAKITIEFAGIKNITGKVTKEKVDVYFQGMKTSCDNIIKNAKHFKTDIEVTPEWNMSSLYNMSIIIEKDILMVEDMKGKLVGYLKHIREDKYVSAIIKEADTAVVKFNKELYDILSNIKFRTKIENETCPVYIR